MKPRYLILSSILFLGILQGIAVLEGGHVMFLSGTSSYLLMMITFTISRKYYIKSDFENSKILSLYFTIAIISIIRGFFEAQNYWDWKYLIFDTTLTMLSPLICLIGSVKDISQAIYYNYIKYLIPFSFLVLIGTKYTVNTDVYGRFMTPITLIILFWPLLNNKWKLFIIILALLSIFSDLSSRSNIIRIIVAACLMMTYYFRVLIHKNMMEMIRIILFIIPFVFFILGVTGILNVFKIGEDSDKEIIVKTEVKGEADEENLSADTRTFIYEEVISSGIYRNTWLFGESAAGGYISEAFEEDNLSSKGRARSEVGILDQFNYLGIVGTFAFTLVFYFASFLAINRSNNYICKLIGLFIAFRWTYSWIEEIPDFSMIYYFLWLTIGLCFSKPFREMTDEQIKIWVLGIFDKKYIENNEFI